jgi:hypothetical protein
MTLRKTIFDFQTDLEGDPGSGDVSSASLLVWHIVGEPSSGNMPLEVPAPQPQRQSSTHEKFKKGLC